jgi:hypothetical protein
MLFDVFPAEAVSAVTEIEKTANFSSLGTASWH